MKTLLAIVTIFLLITGTADAQDTAKHVTVPVPKVTGPIPNTSTSQPLMAANVNLPPIDLAARGYVEEEFFVSGIANVYHWETNGTIKVRSSGLPYTTRILVRRPSNR